MELLPHKNTHMKCATKHTHMHYIHIHESTLRFPRGHTVVVLQLDNSIFVLNHANFLKLGHIRVEPYSTATTSQDPESRRRRKFKRNR